MDKKEPRAEFQLPVLSCTIFGNCINNLTNLAELYLIENNVSDISALGALSNLEFLDLRNNQISDISVLSTLTISLLGLNLSNNQIFDISAISGLTNLLLLDITGNPLTQEQIDELQAALPDCLIIF